MASKRVKASRRVAFRLAQAERLTREAAELLADAVPPEALARDREMLGLLAGLLRETAEAYEPAKGWPNARKGG